MKTAYMMIGLPYSGKSTWVRKNNAFHDGSYIAASSDHVIDFVSSKYDFGYNEVFHDLIQFANRVFNRDIDRAIETDKNLVIDRTNLSRDARAALITPLRKAGYDVVAVFHDVEYEVLLHRRARRPEKVVSHEVVENMRKRMQPPHESEGFSEILYFYHGE
jgi:predicted kinase